MLSHGRRSALLLLLGTMLAVVSCLAPTPSPPSSPPATSPPSYPFSVYCNEDTAWPSSQLTCEAGIAAAVGAFGHPIDAVIVAAHFFRGGYCPDGMECPAPHWNSGYVVLDLQGAVRQRVWIVVFAEDDGTVTASVEGDFPPEAPVIVP
jgi:hypothetical protein